MFYKRLFLGFTLFFLFSLEAFASHIQKGDWIFLTPADATLALRLALKITLPSPAQLQAADLNEDGQVTIAEVTTLLRRALNVEG